MDDAPDEDDIAKWADSLSPEGSPGVMSKRLREYLGDRGYEKIVAQNDAASEAYLTKQRLINNILSLVVFYGVIFGFVALVASVAVLIKFIL